MRLSSAAPELKTLSASPLPNCRFPPRPRAQTKQGHPSGASYPGPVLGVGVGRGGLQAEQRKRVTAPGGSEESREGWAGVGCRKDPLAQNLWHCK